MSKTNKVEIKGIEINFFKINSSDFISLTDIARYKDKKKTDQVIQNWLRTKSTVEFLGLWERINNPNFKPLEFEGFKKIATLQIKLLIGSKTLNKLLLSE